MEQLEMFPDLPYEAPDDRLRPPGAQTVWYYVTDAKRLRMLSAVAGDGEIGWVPLDLGSPSIFLFNCRAVARRWASQLGGKVKKYPYTTYHLYSR